MDAMRAQSLKFGTTIRTETISRVDLSKRPFKVWVEGTEDDDSKAITTDSVIVATYVVFPRARIKLVAEPLQRECIFPAKMYIGRLGSLHVQSVMVPFPSFATNVRALLLTMISAGCHRRG